MATGIQTGMRTGSRSGLATGRSAIGKGPAGGGGGPFGKFKEIWGGLGKGVRLFIMVLVGLVVVGAATMGVIRRADAYQPLYHTKLSSQDVKDISMALSDMGIPHTVSKTQDGIMVPPSMRARAQIELAGRGLPRHPITTPYNTPAQGLSAKTQEAQKALQRRLTEGQLTEDIREIDGVADVWVNIAQPPYSYFDDDSQPTKATVLVKMEPDHHLSRQQVKGIVHLVAYSVPDLEGKNVKVLNRHGVDLTAMLAKGPDGLASDGGALKDETRIEDALAQKVQNTLNTVLGPGKAVANVNVELDFSQNKVTRKTVGGAADQGSVVVGKEIKQENYRRDPGKDGPSARQMSFGPQQASLDGKSKNANYSQTIESYKVVPDETVTESIDKTPRIKRLTCSVLVDNLQQDQVAKIAGIVKDTIGYDGSRGDSITVQSMPFHQNPKALLQEGGALPAGFQRHQPEAASGLSFSQVTAAVSVGALILLGLIMLFLIKQHKVHVGQGKLLLGSNASGVTSSDIADLLNEKSGKSNAPASSAAETKVNTTDELEKLAKERPTKVAEMLKSTWLSGGGG